MSDPTTSIATLSGQSDGLELLTGQLGKLLDMGTLLRKSGLCPSSVDTPEAAVAIVLAGRELGMGVMQSLRSFHVVEGKPVMEASAQLSRAISAGVVCEWVKTDEKVAELRLSRAGLSYLSRWTFAMAERAGITGPSRSGKPSNWAKSPEAMLRARAITAGIRAFCPDVLGGGALYSADELAGDRDDQPPIVVQSRPVSVSEAIDVSDPPAPTEHHPSWARDRPGFCAALGEMGIGYDDVAAFLESLGSPRPSHAAPAYRAGLLKRLGTPEGRAALDAFLAPVAEPGSEG